jgi:hypothetical protein
MAVIEVDAALKDSTVADLLKFEPILSVRQIEL